MLREEEKHGNDEYSFSLPSQRDQTRMVRCASVSTTYKPSNSSKGDLAKNSRLELGTPEEILDRLEKGICIYKRFVVDNGNSLKISSDFDVLNNSVPPEKKGYGRRVMNIKLRSNKIEFRKEYMGKIQIENQYPLSAVSLFKLSSTAAQTLKYKQMYRGQRDFINVNDHKKFIKLLNCNLFEFYINIDNVGKINCICCSEEDMSLVKIGLSMLNRN